MIVSLDGTIEATDPKTSSALARACGHYHLVQAGGPVVMLSREDSGGRPGVLMAGELLTSTTAIEIVGLISQSGWRGELSLEGHDVKRGLVFDQGVLKVTHSTAPGERLGEVMVAFGALTPAQLQQILDDDSGRRFGEVAIARGFVSRDNVFDQLVRQARRVFEGAVLMEAGNYAFVLHDAETTIDAPITVHLPVQGLLMDSMQRVDEMAVFRQKIPDGNARPRPRHVSARLTLPDSLHPVAALSDGEHSVLEIAEQLNLDEFETTKAIAKLIQIGFVDVEPAPLKDDRVRWLIERFSEVLREITTAVAADGAPEWRLVEAITGGPLLDFFSDAIGDDGVLDTDVVLAAIAKVGMENPYEVLQQALHDLASFAMFAAGPLLTRQNEQKLRESLRKKESELLHP